MGQAALGVTLAGPRVAEVDVDPIHLTGCKELGELVSIGVHEKDIGQSGVYTPFHGDHHGVRHHLNGDEQYVRLRGRCPLREPSFAAAKLHPQLPRLRHQLPPVALMCIRIPDQLCGTALHPGDQILLFSHPHRKNLRRSYFFIV